MKVRLKIFWCGCIKRNICVFSFSDIFYWENKNFCKDMWQCCKFQYTHHITHNTVVVTGTKIPNNKVEGNSVHKYFRNERCDINSMLHACYALSHLVHGNRCRPLRNNILWTHQRVPWVDIWYVSCPNSLQKIADICIVLRCDVAKKGDMFTGSVFSDIDQQLRGYYPGEM